MKVEFLEKKVEKKYIVPKVGQPWKYLTGLGIYVRIPDEMGRKALGLENNPADLFFSINLNSGVLNYTSLFCDSIILLQPVGGSLKFEEI